jgi:ABC-type sugar transport system substrate-binding protein
LCHIGYAQDSAGRLAAEFVREQLPRPGKIALLATSFTDTPRNANVSERLAGFKEQWVCEPGHAALCTLVPVTAGHDFSAMLGDPELVFVVALDAQAAESALKALAAQSPIGNVPIIAFEPNKAIFDAIQDGRVSSAIFDDPYRSGFTAVERLRHYRETEKFALPVPGYGNFYLYSEVVQKENVAAIRRRLES